MSWLIGTVRETHEETPRARSILLEVPGWRGHLAGQHVDVRLTASDGYTATRSYSLSSAATAPAAAAGEAGAGPAAMVEIAVDRLDDGEVSPYLTEVLAVGDPLELRGPVGGWFVWRPEQPESVQLVAGGSGIVPLMAMVRTRAMLEGTQPAFRLLYSVRTPADAMFRTELDALADGDEGLEVTYAYTRAAPAGWARSAGRVDQELVDAAVMPAKQAPTCYVCGPTAFVEHVVTLLMAAGHDTARIRTERFGASGR